MLSPRSGHPSSPSYPLGRLLKAAKIKSKKANARCMQRDITKSNHAKPSHFKAFRLLPFLNSLCRMYSGISRFSSSS